MRRLTLLPLLILPLLAAAQEERPAWSLPIEEVPVVTRRTMKEIGVQRTQLDSTVLHDNISLSMADVLTQNANLFIKSYGRATLATAEFRGTSPSHTQVTWHWAAPSCSAPARPRSGAGKRNTCRASGRSRPSTNTCA